MTWRSMIDLSPLYTSVPYHIPPRRCKKIIRLTEQGRKARVRRLVSSTHRHYGGGTIPVHSIEIYT